MLHERLYPDSLRRLTILRGLVLAIELVALAIGGLWLGAVLPFGPILVILLLQAAVASLLAWRLRQTGSIEPSEVFSHLLVDAIAIAVLVYFTGGYANPFISLLLLPLIQATVLLSTRNAWLMAGLVAVAYTLLMREYRPLVLAVSSETAVNLHLAGMWLNFLFTAALIAAFMGRLAEALRLREATLAREREERLRDERLFALGLQAASAAHELATPLTSIRLILDDLQQDYAGDDELGRPLALLDGQVNRMEHVLGQLRDAARGRNAPVNGSLPVERWLARIVEHWGLMRPDARVTVSVPPHLPAQAADPAIESILVTLLNNAWEASHDELRLCAGQEGQSLWIEVIDRGTGLGKGKPPGWGVGLDLARAGLARLGGKLEIQDAAEGGTRARIHLPKGETNNE